MIDLIFYSLLAYGLVMAVKPLINLILVFIRDTWDKQQEWNKNRTKNWMDAYHRGEGNYEHYDPDKPTWNKELMEADYDQDKWDDPFYIEESKDEKEH